MSALDLGREARSFAQEIQDLLDAALPGERQIEAVRFESRYVVQPVTRQGNESVPLMFAGDLLATLRFSYQCAEDHVGDYLVVQRSRFGLYLASVRTPLVRLEYTPDLQGIPSAHWHFHAERGAFTELLTRQSSRTPTRTLVIAPSRGRGPDAALPRGLPGVRDT